MKNLTASEANQLRLSPPDNMTLPEAAAYLRIASSTLWKLKQKNEVRFARIGKRLVFQRTALDGLLSQASKV